MVYKFFGISAVVAFGYAAFCERLPLCVSAVFDGVGSAVTLTLSLAGMLCFWNGMVNLIKNSRYLSFISKLFSPITDILFPASKRNAETKSELSLFICSNMMGLGNAATPIALTVMTKLDDGKETVNDDMIMLCLISTAPITLTPTTILTILNTGGCAAPAAILPYVWLSSFLSFLTAVILGKVYIFFRRKSHA